MVRGKVNTEYGLMQMTEEIFQTLRLCQLLLAISSGLLMNV